MAAAGSVAAVHPFGLSARAGRMIGQSALLAVGLFAIAKAFGDVPPPCYTQVTGCCISPPSTFLVWSDRL